MIYFYESIVAKTLETIKDSYDCADILHDLYRIEQAKANVDSYEGLLAADQLDRGLRQKYPFIDVMLNFADTMLPPAPRATAASSKSAIAISVLTQDYYGILCDTAIKKEIVKEMKQFIKSVD